jgi:hypothetical protein
MVREIVPMKARYPGELHVCPKCSKPRSVNDMVIVHGKLVVEQRMMCRWCAEIRPPDQGVNT